MNRVTAVIPWLLCALALAACRDLSREQRRAIRAATATAESLTLTAAAGPTVGITPTLPATAVPPGATAVGTPLPPPTPIPTRPAPVGTPPSATGFYYGIVQLVADEASFRSPETLRQQMQAIRPLGANVILQEFPPQLTGEDWRTYLDVAALEGLVVIGKIGPIDWNPDPADLTPLTDILDVVAGHPALYSFQYLHEPWEVLSTAQIQGMYRQLKATYPDVRLGVGLSGTIPRFNRGDRQFADDICDFCLVNMKAFQNDPAVAAQQGLERVDVSAPIILQGDPDAELWSSSQVWAPPDGGRRGFRVPSPGEMQALFCTLRSEYPQLRGFLWEVWTVDKASQGTLSEPAMAPQRQAIRDIYDRCVINTP